MRSALLFLLVFLNTAWSAYGQTTACGVTVNAGTDKSLCFPGGATQLNGSITGDYMSFSWSPPVNPNTLQPTVVLNSTTTYTLTAQTYNPSSNLIVNPDFSQGAVGFSTDYIHDPMLIYLPGYYAIVTSPDLIYGNFPPCDDHSPGQGNMMIVDGSTNANDDIWCQTIPVSPNTTYVFGAWVGTIVPIALAQIQFMINNQPLGAPITAPSGVCVWTQFFQTWNSGAATSATICIRDLNTANLGNDFGLDDLFFAPLCSVSDPVTVSVVQPIATAPLIQFLPCASGQLVLNAGGSSAGPNYSYLWTTADGHIVSGANTLSPLVDEVGSYTLVVTYNGGGATCTATANVIVTGDPSTPFAFATPQGQLNCNNPAINIFGAGSSQGANISYQWTTANGNILSNPNLINIQVDAAGTYVLTVTNTANGCSATASAQVVFNGVLPTVQAIDSMALTCLSSQIQLDGSGSSTGPNFSYLWTTSNGSIVSGATSLSPVVDAPGAYTLTVTNALTGCVDSTSVVVLDEQDPPVAVIGGAADLTCLSPYSLLDASASTAGPGVVISWSTGNGSFSSPTDSLIAEADAAGTYILILNYPQTGCADTSSVGVLDIQVFPAPEIAGAGDLSCADPVIARTAQDPSNTQASYSWSTAGGAFSGPTDSLQATATAAGLYWIVATDTLSGCVASDTVEVFGEALLPFVQIAAPDTLTCLSTEIQLDAGASDAGPSIIYQWTSSDGNIVSGGQSLTPIVDQVGTYELIVTDTSNFCASTATALVGENTIAPVAAAGPDGMLTCATPEFWLDGSASQFDPASVQIQWSSADGALIGDLDSLFVMAILPGTYILQLTNTQNGCSSADTVMVGADQDIPMAAIQAPGMLNCAQTTLSLDASGSSSGPDIQYLWESAQGNIVSGSDGPMPLVDLPGWYLLTVTNTASGCQQQDSVLVAADFAQPLAEAGLSGTITCSTPEVVLDGNASSQGPEFTYSWTVSGGNISGDPSSALSSADQPGVYYLSVANIQNGCIALDSVVVGIDTLTPIAQAIAAGTLTCANPVTMLDGSGSSAGPQISYVWTTADGIISGPINTMQVQANAPGAYTLTVSNAQNGCQAAATVDVLQDAAVPQVDAGMGGTLNCLEPQLSLSGTFVSSGNTVFQWSTTTGNFSGGVNTLAPQVDAPGWYYLSAENLDNDCISTDSVFVDQNIVIPQINLAAPGPITCLSPSEILSAPGSSQGPDFAYNWSTVGGNINGNPNGLFVEADEAGIYYLTITNLSNGCFALDSVEVVADTLAPIAQAQVFNPITCLDPLAALSGVGSSAGPGILYSWSTPNGTIEGPANALLAEASEPGTYVLTVLNTGNGCSATAQAEVSGNTEIPQVDAGNSALLTCVNTVLNLEGALANSDNMSILWTTFSGNVLSGANTLSPSIDAPGWYYLAVEDLSNGCTGGDSVLVEIDTLSPAITAGMDAFFPCNANSVALNGDILNPFGSYLIQWSTPDGLILGDVSSLTPEAGAPGVYFMEVTDLENGCSSEAEVTLSAQGIELVDYSLLLPPCPGDSGSLTVDLVLGGVLPYQYSIDGGSAFQSGAVFSGLVPGYYELVVEDANACLNAQEVEVEGPLAIEVLLPEEIPVELGTSVEIHPVIHPDPGQIVQVIWEPVTGLSCSDCLFPYATVLQTTLYQVTVSDANGCSASAQTIIRVDPSVSLYAPNIFSPNADGINDVFTIFSKEGKIKKINRLVIWSRWGESVFEAKDMAPGVSSQGWDGTFRSKPLSEGVYTWVAEVEFIDGRTELYEGDVTLVR
ncbi:MAG: gliding motility-associated C-terminal domain-containing protein [Saprospirales bacterium]|nr:gliding motility-associated C-terminal domain-containing protein [Saprospirales bacterium]